MLMREETADVVFVDPPYNVRVDGHVSGKEKSGIASLRKAPESLTGKSSSSS